MIAWQGDAAARSAAPGTPKLTELTCPIALGAVTRTLTPVSRGPRAGRASALCLLLVVARPSAMDRGAGPPAPVTVTPFESRGPGEVIVPVTVGGRGGYRFLLDTGSTHTAVTQDLASAVGARVVARTSMSAAGGTLECLVVALAGSR